MIGLITMVRLTGFVTIAGRRELLNWTITENGIVEGAGLSASDITIHNHIETPVPLPSTPKTSETLVVATTEPTAYEDTTKTELQVLCSQRGLTVSGTKAEIIARLVVDDESVEESEETEPITDGDENGGESESE